MFLDVWIFKASGVFFESCSCHEDHQLLCPSEATNRTDEETSEKARVEVRLYFFVLWTPPKCERSWNIHEEFYGWFCLFPSSFSLAYILRPWSLVPIHGNAAWHQLGATSQRVGDGLKPNGPRRWWWVLFTFKEEPAILMWRERKSL